MRLPWKGRSEIDEELQSHLQMAIDDRIARGQTPDDAARDARREFGNQLVIRERVGDVWASRAIERTAQNLRYAIRQLRRTPAFTGVAVLSLTCGLAAAAGAFAVVDSVLLQPLNYAAPERLFSIVNRPPTGTANRFWMINGRQFSEWRAHCTSCDDVGMAESIGFMLADAGEPERFSGLRVSYNFFRTLGVRPALGRDFRAEDETVGRHRVVLLSDALWRRRFGADRSVVGRTVAFDGRTFEIVGVLPARFWWPTRPDVVVPLALDDHDRTLRAAHFLEAIDRVQCSAGPVGNYLEPRSCRFEHRHLAWCGIGKFGRVARGKRERVDRHTLSVRSIEDAVQLLAGGWLDGSFDLIVFDLFELVAVFVSEGGIDAVR